MKKRILSFILCLAMMLSMVLVAVPVSAATTMTMTALDASENDAESGDVITIDGKAELDLFSKYVTAKRNTENVTFKLLSDVTYNEGNASQWKDTAPANTYTPAGDYNISFKGIFDGNYKTISGLYVNSTGRYIGFIGSLGGATVKDLSIVNSYFYTDKTGASAIAGAVNAGENYISNVYVDAIVYAVTDSGQSHGFVGGVVGFATGYTSLTISNVEVHGSFGAGKASVGGIVGRITSKPITVTNCEIYATVTGTQRLGGVVGSDESSSSQYSNIYVDAAIDSTSKTDTYVWIGGVVGYGSATKSSIENVVVEGDVTTTKGSSGGIIGEISNGKTVTVSNAVNLATISANTAGGGIIGYNNGGTVTLTNCINGGTLSIKGFCGGMIGRNNAANGAIIDSCAIVSNKCSYVNTYYKEPVGNIDATDCTYVSVDSISDVAEAVTFDTADKWENTESYGLIPKTVETMLKNAPGDVMAQATAAVDGVYSVRFLVSVDTLDYEAVAIYITATTGNTTKEFFVNMTEAYTSVLACGDTVEASNYGGKYLLAHAIEGVNVAGEDIVWTVQVITISNGIYNETEAVTFNGNIVANGEEVK